MRIETDMDGEWMRVQFFDDKRLVLIVERDAEEKRLCVYNMTNMKRQDPEIEIELKER